MSKYFIVIIISCLLFASCTHYYYGPNSNNTPLLREKEGKVNVQFASSDNFKALEVQTAFAVTRHTGFMVNFITGGGKEKNSLDIDDESGTAHLYEAGAGYFTPMNKGTVQFETFGGAGIGRVNNVHDSGRRSSVKLVRYFVQPAIGVRKKGSEFAFSSRLSYVRHTLDFNSVKDGPDAMDLEYLADHPTSFLVEPAFVLRFGTPDFLFQLQYTFSLNITNPELKQERGLFNVGVCIPIHYNTIGN